MQASFVRISPSAYSEKASIPAGWFVVSHRWLPNKPERRLSHGRWFKIKSQYGVVFRILQLAPNLKGSPAQGSGEIVLDWPAWLHLFGYAEQVDDSLMLTISKARWWHLPKLAISHPDPTLRLSGLLGLLSFVLGVVSLALAIVAF